MRIHFTQILFLESLVFVWHFYASFTTLRTAEWENERLAADVTIVQKCFKIIASDNVKVPKETIIQRRKYQLSHRLKILVKQFARLKRILCIQKMFLSVEMNWISFFDRPITFFLSAFFLSSQLSRRSFSRAKPVASENLSCFHLIKTHFLVIRITNPTQGHIFIVKLVFMSGQSIQFERRARNL